MSLPPGNYTILGKGSEREVGRYQVEDKSLLPKPIYSLPQGAKPLGPVCIVIFMF